MCEMTDHEIGDLADAAESAGRLEAENTRLRAALNKAADELKAAGCPYASTQARAAAELKD
jgi:hypothetical protein